MAALPERLRHKAAMELEGAAADTVQ